MQDHPAAESQPGPHYIDDTWTLHFHDASDSDWTHSSYVRVADVSSLEDFAAMQLALRDRVAGGMFFVMREHVFPCWDDPNNIEGGCVTVRVAKQHAEQVWNEVVLHALCDAVWTGGDGDIANVVNGVSISPKAVYAIIKIWVSAEVNPADVVFSTNPRVRSLLGHVMYKPNREYIHANNAALRLRSGAPHSSAHSSAYSSA